jgi:hypothetical protein
LYKEELYHLYSSPNTIIMIKSIRIKWVSHVACMGEKRNAYRVLVGRPERKGPLGIPRRGWGDNIKMHRREIE